MPWWTFVQQTARGDTQARIGGRIGVTGPSVGRWSKGALPDPSTAARFAREYGRPVLEAFLAAGYLTPEEADAQPSQQRPITTYSGDELADEIRDRLRKGERDAQAKPSEKSSEPVLETEPATQLGRQQQPTAPGQRPAPAHKGRARSR